MNNRIPSSIFNNVLGPVMRGPSSSHTAAAVRIGKLAVRLLGEEPASITFRFDPAGSLATTYRGQGSAMGLAAGLLGMDMTDPDILRAEEICRDKGPAINYNIEKTGDKHPNSYNTIIQGKSGKEISFTAISTGGGIVRLLRLDGEDVIDDFDYINPLMPVELLRDSKAYISGINDIKSADRSLAELAAEYETSVSSLKEDEVLFLAVSHLAIIKNSIETGMSGTEYSNRILHRQSHLISKVPEKGDIIPAGVVNRIIESVTAIMESKSAMELIVAAPTAGSAGVLGGLLMPVAELCGKTENELARAFLAAGMIGIFISYEGGFAAENGGCQYECGSASGMAAAALVDLMGGTAEMAINAASLALQNTMGMICDPVADRVEVPCLGRNIMAALNALAAANMIIAGFDHVIPLDEAIKAMKEVGDNMDSRYRCTCRGGLSNTPTSKRIHEDLSSRQSEATGDL